MLSPRGVILSKKTVATSKFSFPLLTSFPTINMTANLHCIESFRYFNPADNPDAIIEFRRAWWDHRQTDDLWLAQARDRKGDCLNARHVTGAYVADILDRFREHIEITYRERETIAAPFSLPD